MKTFFAYFGAIHLVADIAVFSFLWWWSHISAEEEEVEVELEMRELTRKVPELDRELGRGHGEEIMRKKGLIP